MRTNLTNARKAGVTSRPVRGDEQRALLDELAVLRNHPGLADWLHRQFGEVLECFVAEDADDGLIGVGAVVIDTDVAVVAYHASVPGHPLRSDARWVLWADVIREALRRHARVILVESGPLSLDDGLVYFQRRLGFGVYNLKLRH